jgi:hypothetical protein
MPKQEDMQQEKKNFFDYLLSAFTKSCSKTNP